MKKGTLKKPIDRAEITKISKEFSEPFYETCGSIEESGWLIVDPLSAYLNFCGFENKLDQLPANDKHPQVMVMTFKDGSQFIPGGAAMKVIHEGFENWMWV